MHGLWLSSMQTLVHCLILFCYHVMAAEIVLNFIFTIQVSFHSFLNIYYECQLLYLLLSATEEKLLVLTFHHPRAFRHGLMNVNTKKTNNILVNQI